jgi:hypothetical protein
MDKVYVYLDHHIKRESLRYQRPDDKIQARTEEKAPTLRLVDLTRPDDPYVLTRYLRKPDFQRATWSWTPEDCVNLLESIINYQVVPSIIMWTSPVNNLTYILDGAHRISVFVAWLNDDWGEDQANNIADPRQADSVRDAAKKVREEMQKRRIGTYKEFIDAEADLQALIDQNIDNIKARLGEEQFKRGKFFQDFRKSDIAFHILWVKGDYQIAERSFLRINKSGQQLTDWEIKLIENRDSSFARAVMSLTSPESAQHYWPEHVPENEDRDKLEEEVRDIIKEVNYLQSILFTPPYTKPISRLEQPLLATTPDKKPVYVAELLTVTEGFRGQQPQTEELLKRSQSIFPREIINGGHKLLKNAHEYFDHLVGTSSKSLAIIPLLYFYKSDGAYIRSLLYGFIFWLCQGKESDIQLRKDLFSAYRGPFEILLRKDKDIIVNEIGRKIGSGPEVTLHTSNYFQNLMELLIKHKGDIENTAFLTDYSVLISQVAGQNSIAKPVEEVRRRIFSPRQKINLIIETLLDNLGYCQICGGKLNPVGAVQHDHIQRFKDGGFTTADNQRLTHPYCNLRRDIIETYRVSQTLVRLPEFVYKQNPKGPQQLKLAFFADD